MSIKLQALACIAAVLLSAQAAAQPAQVSADNTVESTESARVLELAGGVRIRLEPGTSVRRLPGTELILPVRGKTPTHQLLLERGTIHVQVAPATTEQVHAVLVRNSTNRMAVIQTGSSSIVKSSNALVVANHAGTVLTGSPQAIRGLGAGYVIRMPDSRADALPSKLLDAPAFQSGPRVLTQIGNANSPLQVNWAPVAGAAKYQFELRRPGSTEPLCQVSSQATDLTWREPLVPGAYEMTLRSVDSDGIMGPPSAPEQVSVVEIVAPAGAAIDGQGRVHLLPSQQLGLGSTAGLEVSTGNLASWFKAQEQYGLAGKHETTVFLRRAGTRGGVPVTMIERKLWADVELSPANPVWPKDSIGIVVRLHDSAGASDMADVTPVVRVGLEQVTADWQRSGGLFRTAIRPRHGAGPCVVRVSVLERSGIEIGRGFVEVTRANPR